MTIENRLWPSYTWMAAGAVVLTLADFFMKLLALEGVGVTTAFMYATPLSVVLIALLAKSSGGIAYHLRVKSISAVLIRGGLLITMSYLNYTGMQHNPYSQQVMILLLAPIFAGLLATFWLGEGMSKHQMLVAVLCLFGSWMIIDPRFGSGSWYLLLPLAAALTNALANTFIASRRQAATPLGYTFYGLLMVALLSTVIHLWQQAPAPELLALVYCQILGALGVLGLAFVARAMQLAGSQGDTGKVALMIYVQLPVAILIGYLVLHETVNVASLLGAALILFAGISLPLKRSMEAMKRSAQLRNVQ